MSRVDEDPWAEERLQRWAHARDKDALGELLKWQRSRAFATALRILRQSQDAEDAVQQALLKVFTRTQGFENLQAFRSTVYRAVVQCSLDLLRARNARSQRESLMPTRSAPAWTEASMQAENREAAGILSDEMGRLTPEDRALVALCCQEGLKLGEAAVVLEMPRETLRDRLSRTLSDLRASLERRGLRLSPLLLLGLLGQDHAVSAPATLCAALDAGLPGTACAQVAPASIMPCPDLSLFSGLAPRTIPFQAAAAACLLAVLGAAVAIYATARPTPPSAPAPFVQKAALTPPKTMQPEAQPVAPQEDSKKEVPAASREPARPMADELGIPAEVRRAAEAALQGFKIQKMEKDKRKGVPVYELEGAVGDERFEVVVNEAGKVLEVKKADDDEEEGKKPEVPQERPAEPF